jgi:hypothetical protein
LVKDTATGGQRFIPVVVNPLEALDVRLEQEMQLDPELNDIEFIFPEMCEARKLACGVEYANVSHPANRKEYLKGVPKRQWHNEVARRENRRLNVILSRAKPHTVLDGISSSPDYQWSRQGDVLNLQPKRGKGWERDGGSVLDKKIDGPIAIANLPAPQAMQLVFQKAGINVEQTLHLGGRTDRKFPPISLSLKDETVRECLNDIVGADGQAIWYFGQEFPGKYAFSASRWGSE